MTKTPQQIRNEVEKKEYPYMKRKSQININISRSVIVEMDKERLDVDILDFSFGGIMTRSEFIQKAIINYIMELRKLKDKFKDKVTSND